jgi:hypothetical protein
MYVEWKNLRNEVALDIDYYKNKKKELEDCNIKLIEFARLVKECPANSVHLMHLAADALLKQLHTDPVVSE